MQRSLQPHAAAFLDNLDSMLGFQHQQGRKGPRRKGEMQGYDASRSYMDNLASLMSDYGGIHSSQKAPPGSPEAVFGRRKSLLMHARSRRSLGRESDWSQYSSEVEEQGSGDDEEEEEDRNGQARMNPADIGLLDFELASVGSRVTRRLSPCPAPCCSSRPSPQAELGAQAMRKFGIQLPEDSQEALDAEEGIPDPQSTPLGSPVDSLTPEASARDLTGQTSPSFPRSRKPSSSSPSTRSPTRRSPSRSRTSSPLVMHRWPGAAAGQVIVVRPPSPSTGRDEPGYSYWLRGSSRAGSPPRSPAISPRRHPGHVLLRASPHDGVQWTNARPREASERPSDPGGDASVQRCGATSCPPPFPLPYRFARPT